MRAIDEIIIHCTATEGGNSVPIEKIESWHKAKGYASIGYHYIIQPNGSIQIGRRISKAGAHCKGHNANSIGIAYVGGLNDGKPQDTRTMAQIESLQLLIAILLTMYPDIKKITGHNEYSNKACPCFNVQQYRNMFSVFLNS